MTIAPLAVLAAMLLAAILSGAFLINMAVANYMMAMACVAAICGLGLVVGVFVGTQGTRLDGLEKRTRNPGLDLSADILQSLRDIPEGAVMVGVPPVYAGAIDGLPSADDEEDDFGEDSAHGVPDRKSLDEILPNIGEEEDSEAGAPEEEQSGAEAEAATEAEAGEGKDASEEPMTDAIGVEAGQAPEDGNAEKEDDGPEYPSGSEPEADVTDEEAKGEAGEEAESGDGASEGDALSSEDEGPEGQTTSDNDEDADMTKPAGDASGE